MDVDNLQWNTAHTGGQPSLAELQDLPDHKLRQKYDFMTSRCKFVTSPHEHDQSLLQKAHHWTQHYTVYLRRLVSCPKPFIAPFNLWNDDGWVRLEHHVANVNVSNVLENDDFSDKPYHSSAADTPRTQTAPKSRELATPASSRP
ncbi:hypothetical protein RI367_008741 [Sorochytrium milnesiophthora]